MAGHEFWFYFVGDVKPAMQSVVKLINKELDVTNDEEVRIVESTQKTHTKNFSPLPSLAL
jgi:hypothetical protein